MVQRERGDAGDDEILCNGAPLKRIDLSLQDQQEGDVLVDLFVEDEGVEGNPNFDSYNVLWLEPFEIGEDEEGGAIGFGDDDDDPDGKEVDYPSSDDSSSSSPQGKKEKKVEGDGCSSMGCLSYFPPFP